MTKPLEDDKVALSADPASAIRRKRVSHDQLSDELAHALNNPAAYVLNNIEHLRELLADNEDELRKAGMGKLLEEVDGALTDCLDGMERIRQVVAELGQPRGERPEEPGRALGRKRRVRFEGRRPKVLLVDDEQPILRALQRALKQRCKLTAIDDASRALALLLKPGCDFELIICDLALPGMTGMALYDRVKVERPEMARRFVFLTGAVNHGASPEFAQRHAGRILEKPANLKRLNAIVRRISAGDSVFDAVEQTKADDTRS